jgi:hypothetical protein
MERSSSSWSRRSELLQDRAHAGLFRIDEARERVAIEIPIEPTVAGQRLAPRRRLDHRPHDGLEARAIGRR